MKTGLLDLLVVGGPKVIKAQGDSLRVEQLPFTFDGLGKAYQNLHRTDVLILAPDENTFSSMPEAGDFAGFIPEGERGLNPIFANLRLVSFAPIVQKNTEKTRKKASPKKRNQTSHDQPVPEQVEANLELIQKAHQADFVKRAATEFLLAILKRSTTLINGGGTVYLLLPENLNGLNADLQELVHAVVPGIQVWSEPAPCKADPPSRSFSRRCGLTSGATPPHPCCPPWADVPGARADGMPG